MSKKKKISDNSKPVSGGEENGTIDNATESVSEEVKNPEDNTLELSQEEIKEPEIEETEKKLQELQAKYDELNDKYVRLYADFDNFRKRTIKERIEFITNANEEMIFSLLPILDDFDRATKFIAETMDIDAIIQGYELISNKIKNILSQKNLKEMDVLGMNFDPELHEAVSQVTAPSEEMKGKIIEVVEKGYYLNDKVIRHAKVVVGG